MAWESNATAGTDVPAYPRQNSSAAGGRRRGLSLRQKTPSSSASIPAATHTAHVADPFLQAFLEPSFDPATYWNRAFETAATTPAAKERSAAAAPSSSSLAGQAQTAQATLSQVSAHTARLTGVLTQLTDDILRSGSRLAYEVELLRGEAIGLSEVVAAAAATVAEGRVEGKGEVEEEEELKGEEENPEEKKKDGKETDTDANGAPATALAQLRMLAQVRSRLDGVIRTFGDAMEFVMPPSALSMTASFLSVSGPGSGSGGDGDSSAQDGGSGTTEQKGQQVLRARREEIARLLAAADGPAAAEVEAATARVAALRTLCRVWAGTPEEKARVRFVEGLQRMVDDRVRDLERAAAREKEREDAAAATAAAAASSSSSTSTTPSGSRQTGPDAASQQDANASGNRGYAAAGYGFITQLQKIRSGL